MDEQMTACRSLIKLQAGLDAETWQHYQVLFL